MKPTFQAEKHSTDAPSSLLPRHPRRAFSLVEVTLALGLVTFVLVAVLGTVPVALSSGHQSLDQNRAAAVANTLFASFRGQAFNNVCYLDSQFQSDGATPLSTTGSGTPGNTDPLDLNLLMSSSSPTHFYASFLDPNPLNGSDADTFGEQRRLCFTAYTGTAIQQRPGAANYFVILTFNDTPPGTVIVPSAAIPAQANQIRMLVLPLSQAAGLTPDNLKALDNYLTQTSTPTSTPPSQIAPLVQLASKYTFTTIIANRP